MKYLLIALLVTITACGGSEKETDQEGVHFTVGRLFAEPQDYNGDGILEAEEEFLMPEVYECLDVKGGQWIGYCDTDTDHDYSDYYCKVYEECEFLFCYCESWQAKENIYFY